jgi:hypothetical protein
MRLMLAAACLCSIAAAASPPPARVELPMDWNVGGQQRYRATWTRALEAWRAPGSPPPSMNAQVRGTVAIRVLERSKAGYVLRWEPVLAGAAPPRARGDVDAAAAGAWRLGLSLPLELVVDFERPADPLLRNGGEVRETLARHVQEFLRELPGQADLDCLDRDAGSAACQVVGSEAATSSMVLRSVAPFFRCTGLELSPGAPETWSVPHPNPQIGAAVSIENRREVMGYAPASPRIRVKATTEANAAQLQAWINRQVAAMPGGNDLLQKVVAELSVRFETDCTMDRRTGWPMTIELKTVGGSALYQGSETVRFERIE